MVLLKPLLLYGLLHIIIMATAVSIDETEEIKWDSALDYYLSQYIVPFHYNLKLKLMPDSINGESNISIYINREIETITLHASTLISINEVKLISVEDETIYELNAAYEIIEELCTFNFNDKMSKQNLKYGVYILYLKFSIKNHMAKDVLQIYTKENGNIELFAPLIQPRRARQLFPCWDEPKLSATFKISVEHHQKYEVLSNMPVQEYTFLNNSMMCTVFQITPPMSTNDVAIVISEHLYQVITWDYSSIVNIWCRWHLRSYVTFAQYVAGNITKYLENNFEILEKIPKVNYVAIPSLRDRIRQTWGLVFYNEANIIYNEELHSASYKTTIMRSVTRDIIHQWFGNLFSPFCRSHQLLNEGFITFFEIYVIKKAYSDSGNITDLLIVQTQHEALYLNSYFAMNSFAKNTSNISEFYSYFPFSHIIGASIWRMLNDMLLNVFLHKSLLIDLNAYFNIRFTYLNSPTPDDLWSLIQTSISHKFKNILYDLSIKQIMDIWTKQTHYPVVNVIRNYSNNLVKISKEIYDKLDRKLYFIPVSYTTETNIDFVNISSQVFNCITQSNPEIEIHYDGKDKWFIANILQTGYYRVNYDNKNWRMIARYLNSEKYRNIHVINRAQIIDDAFHLAIEKKLDFSIFWELASYLSRERNYIAWYPMIKVFERISSVFAFLTIHDEHLKEIKITIEGLFKDIDKQMYNQMRLTNDNLDIYLKQDLTKWGCLINNSLCLKMANQQFDWHLKDLKTNKLLPGWNKLISCNGLKIANYTTWFGAWMNALNVYKQEFDYKMLKFLSCSDDPHTILTYLRVDLPNLEALIINDKNRNLKDFETQRQEKERIYALTADIFLSTLTMHAKNFIILENILKYFKIIKNILIISDNKSDIITIAVLIVIINNVYSKNELDEINKFTKDMPQLISEHIDRKITMRLLEIENQIKFYQIMFPQLQLNTLPTECPTTNSITTHSTTTHSTTIHRKTTNKYRWDDLLTKLKFGIDKPLY